MTINDPVATTIWRLHLLPDGTDREWVVAFCHYRSVLGMGWSVEADPNENISWTDYVERSEAKYGSLDKNVRRWKEDVKIGNLVWARTPNKEYLLARVTGEWRYESADEFKAAGMVNIREVEFVPVGNESHVPGRVVNSFFGRTLQKVENVDNLSRYLWNKHCLPTSPKYGDIAADTDLFDILSFQDRDKVISFIGSHLDALPQDTDIADAYRLWQTLQDRG